MTRYDPQAMKLNSTSSTQLLLWPRKTIHKSWTTGEKHLHKRYSYENDIMQVHRMEFCFLLMCFGNAACRISAGLFCPAHLLESCLSTSLTRNLYQNVTASNIPGNKFRAEARDSSQMLVVVSFSFSMDMETHWGSWAPVTAGEPPGRISCSPLFIAPQAGGEGCHSTGKMKSCHWQKTATLDPNFTCPVP